MGLIPKWLRDWMTRLMPQQQSSGSGAVHMGHVSGSVQNITQVHHHFHAASLPAQAPVTPDPEAATAEQVVPAASAPFSPARPPPPAIRPATTAAQKEVLALLRPLPEPVRNTVSAFMRNQFGTAMVIDLQPKQVFRVRRYVEAINSSRREKA